MFAYSYVIFSLSAENSAKGSALLGYFRMPIFYGLALGLLFNYFDIGMPAPITSALHYMRNALIGIVLFILGAQIDGIPFSRVRFRTCAQSQSRLEVGPAVAHLMLFLSGIEGTTAQALLITSAMPAAGNSAIIAQQYSDDPEYAAEIVMMSTLLSAATVSFVIYAAMSVF